MDNVKTHDHIWIFDGLVKGKSATYYDYVCAVCGEHKLKTEQMKSSQPRIKKGEHRNE